MHVNLLGIDLNRIDFNDITLSKSPTIQSGLYFHRIKLMVRDSILSPIILIQSLLERLEATRLVPWRSNDSDSIMPFLPLRTFAKTFEVCFFFRGGGCLSGFMSLKNMKIAWT